MCVCRSSNSNNKKTTTPPHKDYYTNKKHTTTTATSSYNKPQQTTTKAINMHWIKCLLTAFICFTVIVQVSFSLSHLSFFFCLFSGLYIQFVATATCCWIYFCNFRFADIPALLIHVRLRFAAVTNTRTSVLCVWVQGRRAFGVASLPMNRRCEPEISGFL